MNKYLSFLILIIFLFQQSKGDEPIKPCSYEIVGKNYIFIYLYGKDTLRNSAGRPYLKTGLYRNETNAVPLWTIKGLNYSPIFISSDLIYLINLGPWPSLNKDKKRNLNETAIEFYKNGELIKKYDISDLENYSFLLPKSVSHYHWKKKFGLINNEQQFELTTLSYQKYIFDIKTGDIVSHTDYILLFILLLIAGLVIVFVFVNIIIRNEKKKRMNIIP